MEINIGNKNKIKKSIIGKENKVENKENIFITILVSIIAGVIVAGINLILL